MSEENVEIVRQSLAATSGGDPEAAQAAFDPLIEWDMSGVRGWLEKSVYRGPEVLEFLRAWADSWQDWHFDVTDVRDAGEDRVFAAIHEWGIGAESRVDVEQRQSDQSQTLRNLPRYSGAFRRYQAQMRSNWRPRFLGSGSSRVSNRAKLKESTSLTEKSVHDREEELMLDAAIWIQQEPACAPTQVFPRPGWGFEVDPLGVTTCT